jgi:anti-sigma factor RsiW
MHAVVMESLEEYLAGLLEPVQLREIEAHLNGCSTCREEVRGMQDIGLLFSAFSTQESFEPAPGFYARVRQQVDQRKAAPSFASLFTLDLAFGRRLVFACLLTLAFLGTYLVSRETAYSAGPTPDAIMAQQNLPAFDSESAPADNMLVTLTAYEH